MKCSLCYKEWALALGRHVHIEDVTELLHQAMVQYAAARGFAPPPPRLETAPRPFRKRRRRVD